MTEIGHIPVFRIQKLGLFLGSKIQKSGLFPLTVSENRAYFLLTVSQNLYDFLQTIDSVELAIIQIIIISQYEKE